MWTILAQFFRRQNKRENPRESDLGMRIQNTCAKFQGLSLTKGVDILTFVRKNE